MKFVAIVVNELSYITPLVAQFFYLLCPPVLKKLLKMGEIYNKLFNQICLNLKECHVCTNNSNREKKEKSQCGAMNVKFPFAIHVLLFTTVVQTF